MIIHIWLKALAPKSFGESWNPLGSALGPEDLQANFSHDLLNVDLGRIIYSVHLKPAHYRPLPMIELFSTNLRVTNHLAAVHNNRVSGILTHLHLVIKGPT